MKRFITQLDAILENVDNHAIGKVDILHKSGRHIIADHVKKVRSPRGGRLILMAGIGAPEPAVVPLRSATEMMEKHWTYRIRDFYLPHRMSKKPNTGDVRLYNVWQGDGGHNSRGSSIKYQPASRDVSIKKLFKHVLAIDMRNIISINGQAVQRPQESANQEPPVGLDQPQQPGI